MSKRITVIIDDKILQSLRDLQSTVIKKYGMSCSFSKVITIAAKYGAKNLTAEIMKKELEKE